MKRATDFIKRHNNDWMLRKEELSSTTLLLVGRTGPTVFTLTSPTESDQRGTFKVILGNPHICSCRQYNDKNSCIHILYCLLKVLRLPETHPLSWQTSLTDNEIQQVLNTPTYLTSQNRNESLSSRIRNNHPQRSSKKGDVKQDQDNEEKYSQRQELVEDGNSNICPICQDDMSVKTHALTWCRLGCGNNMHAKCMQSLYEFNQKSSSKSSALSSQKSRLQCPLCREPWVLESLKLDLKQPLSCLSEHIQKVANLVCSKIRCSVCLLTVTTGDFYRCIECSHNNNNNNNNKDSVTQICDNISDQEKVNTIAAYDICQKCCVSVSSAGRSSNSSMSKLHKQHHFLLSTLSPTLVPGSRIAVDILRDTDWHPVVNPLHRIFTTTASTNHTNSHNNNENREIISKLIAELQHRDISSNDYDTLLALDEYQTMTTATPTTGLLRHQHQDHQSASSSPHTHSDRVNHFQHSLQTAAAERTVIELSQHLVDTLPTASVYDYNMIHHCWCTAAPINSSNTNNDNNTNINNDNNEEVDYEHNNNDDNDNNNETTPVPIVTLTLPHTTGTNNNTLATTITDTSLPTQMHEKNKCVLRCGHTVHTDCLKRVCIFIITLLHMHTYTNIHKKLRQY